jgi:hypothetical protein
MKAYEVTLNGQHKVMVEATSPYDALDMAELELEDYTTSEDDDWTIRRVS